MHLTTKLATRGVLAGTACVAIALPAVALAANPAKGGTYQSKHGDGSFAMVSKSGKTAKLTVYGGKCNGGFPLKAKKQGKISHGKLTYNGSASSVTGSGGTAHLKLSGKFVTRKTLKWTVHVTDGSCTSTVRETLILTPAG